MYFGGFLMRKPGSWPLRTALRATTTAVTAMIAGYIIDATALPRLRAEAKGLGVSAPPAVGWMSVFEGHLCYVPVPALLAGVAALMLPSVRPILAVAAGLLALLSLAVVVGTLLAVLGPMYAGPRDLKLP